ncbi:type II-A CRISPR-associated protein Csn2 [Bilifractor sp. HCP3S3_D3]|uniref:type II-A CRISPR-associated protein Csn2 n=1 Tax=unclassified Bilifractor TaxID=2815795 RepID=UPI003F8BB3F3
MRWIYSPCNVDLQLDELRPVTLVIENPQHLQKMISAILSQMNSEGDDVILSEGNQLLSLEKNIFLQLNPFEDILNNRKIIGKLYKTISCAAMELPQERSELLTAVIQYFDRILGAVRFDGLIYDIDFKDEDLYKLFDLRIEEEGLSLIEKLLMEVRVCSDLLFLPVMVFMNLGSFLSNDEYCELVESCVNHKVYLLLIEGTEPMDRTGDKRYIIDKDMCLIQKNL